MAVCSTDHVLSEIFRPRPHTRCLPRPDAARESDAAVCLRFLALAQFLQFNLISHHRPKFSFMPLDMVGGRPRYPFPAGNCLVLAPAPFRRFEGSLLLGRFYLC